MPAGDRPEQANKYVKRSPPKLPGFTGGIWCIRCCWEDARACGAGILLAAQKLIDDGGRCFGREGFLKFP